MLAPGMTINATNQVVVNRSAANTSDFIHGGFGFKTNGALCMDDAAPAESVFNNGFRVNNSGCIYVVTATDPGDVYHAGLRRSVLGQLVIEVAAGASFVNGNPLTAAGLFATSV